MALKVFIRLAGLGDQEQPPPFVLSNGTKWTAVQQLLASYYGDTSPDNLDVRYWDEEDYVILSSQEELEEAFRLAEDKSYLQLYVRLMDQADSSVTDPQQPDTSSSVDDAAIADQRGGNHSAPERSEPPALDKGENSLNSEDTAASGQQNICDIASTMELESKADLAGPSENNQVLDYYLCLGEAAASSTGEAASESETTKDVDAETKQQVLEAHMERVMKNKLLKAGKRKESSDREPAMVPGALSGANAIAIEMPEMEHHGTETAEPAEIAETGEMSAESSRDAETGFWMQPRLEAELLTEAIRRHCSSTEIEKEQSHQHSQPQKKHEHKSSRKDKKKKHRAADPASEHADSHKKGKSSSSHPSSNGILETLLMECSSSDTPPPPAVAPSKKPERKSSHKSDSKKKKHHSTDPLTEDTFVRYMTKFESQLKKDMAKEVAKKTVHGVIKKLPRHSEGSESATPPPASVLHSAKRGGYVHKHIICDCCDREIVGTRYICGNCPNYDLCEECEDIQPPFHDRTHVFLKLRKPCLKAGTRHGVRVPLLKRIIYEAKEDGRTLDLDRLQQIMKRMEVEEEDGGSTVEYKEAIEDEIAEEEIQQPIVQPPPQEEELEEETQQQLFQLEENCDRVNEEYSSEVSGGGADVPQECKAERPEEKTDALPSGLKPYGLTSADEMSLLEMVYEQGFKDPTTSVPPAHDSAAEEEEQKEEPEAVKPMLQWLREEEGTPPARRELSPASSIEIVDKEALAATPFNHSSPQPLPHELNTCPLIPLTECQKTGTSYASYRNWLHGNKFSFQEESDDGSSSFTSLSDGLSGDEDFVVITPDCFDMSKPLDNDRYMMLCKKTAKWSNARKEQKGKEASSSDMQEEEFGFFSQEEIEPKREKEKEEEPRLDFVPLAPLKAPPQFQASGVQQLTRNEIGKAVEDFLGEEEGAGAGAKKEEDTTSTLQVDHCAAAEETGEQQQQASGEPSLMKEQAVPETPSRPTGNHQADGDAQDPGDVADAHQTDLKRFTQSDDEEGAAAALSDSLDPNQQLNQMMTNTIKKASNGLQTLFQTGRDIFRTFQRGDSDECEESSYEYKPSDYKLPESTWQPSTKEYVPPKSNFQLKQSQFQLPKSTYMGPKSQVPGGVVGLAGEYAGPLQRIREMGYFNNQRTLALLKQHEGDVQKVVNDLIEEADNDWADQRHGKDTHTA